MRLVLAASLFLVFPARAEDCAELTSEIAMNECAAAAYGTTDAELNRVYRGIMARLAEDEEGRQRLTTAQHAWLAFRDAECAFRTDRSAHGSIHPYLVTSCRDGLSVDRVAQLRGYLTCQEGDLACPVPAP